MAEMKLKEDDFNVLRRPLESGRQSPSSLAFMLILFIFLQALMYAIEYYVAADMTSYPYKEEILHVHFWITAVLIVLCFIYSIPIVYKRSGKIQYLLSILVSHNVATISVLITALFFIGKDEVRGTATPESLLNFTYILLIIGFIIFIFTSIRFYILLKRGHYRKGSKKDELRGRFETKSYLPLAVISGLGVVFIIQFIARNSIINFEALVLILIGILIYFVMLFVLPEQLVILYCKFRFKSFNFDRRGYLNK